MIGLARIGLLELLPKLFNAVYVPGAVVMEATRDQARPGAKAIEQALKNRQLIAHRVDRTEELKKLSIVLDEGEAEVLMLGQQLKLPVRLQKMPVLFDPVLKIESGEPAHASRVLTRTWLDVHSSSSRCKAKISVAGLLANEDFTTRVDFRRRVLFPKTDSCALSPALHIS